MKFRFLHASLLLVFCLALSQSTLAGTDGGTIRASDMSDDAHRTWTLILGGDAGGGRSFSNSGDELPSHPPGYYREYAVHTVGSQVSSQEHIVVGGEGGDVEYFYTDDDFAHYYRIED